MSVSRNFRRALPSLTLLCLAAPMAAAATLNVPYQYRTIQSGINAAQAGDTVLVADGTYTGTGNRDLDFGGKDITVRSVSGAASTIIDCQGSAASPHRGFTLHTGEGPAATIDGFTIKNGYAPVIDAGAYTAAYGGGIDTQGSSATVADCVITGCTVSAQSVNGGGIFMGQYGTLTNCTVSNNTGGGVAVELAATVTNCVVFGNTTRVGTAGIDGGGGLNLVTNCTVFDNTVASAPSEAAAGIWASFIVNCIVWDNTVNQGQEADIPFYKELSINPFVTDSDVGSGYAGTGNFSADPQFVNAAAGDFHLKPGSPCLGTGMVAGAAATDRDGALRPTPPSIGAYEAAGTARTWTAMSVSTGADGYTRILWDRNDGTASVWKISAAGQLVAQQQFGPFSGWTAKAIATGSDNNTRLLWTNVNGAADYYLLNSGDAFVSQLQFGPYTGWTAQSLAVAPDNTTRALWFNADQFVATVWTLDAANHMIGQQQYGPYADFQKGFWTARSITVNPDGTERLLWDNTNGSATFWKLSSTSRFLSQQQYGPYTGYQASSIASAPNGTGRVVWVGTDSHIALWTIDAANAYTGQAQFGPYSGFSPTDIVVGGDGNARLLWDSVTGQSALWSLTPGGAFAANTQFGPY
jgi:hypothetical protein